MARRSPCGSNWPPTPPPGPSIVGYNFLYLSEAVRAGDQVDEVVDPAQVPLFGRPTAAVVERPIPVLERSDFWVQGLVFGVEYRY
jgi:hypothetical protein